jgi:hypothetical protein
MKETTGFDYVSKPPKKIKTKYYALIIIILIIILYIVAFTKTRKINDLKYIIHQKEQFIIQQDAKIQILEDEKNTYLKYWQDCQSFRKIDSLIYESIIHSRYNMP